MFTGVSATVARSRRGVFQIFLLSADVDKLWDDCEKTRFLSTTMSCARGESDCRRFRATTSFVSASWGVLAEVGDGFRFRRKGDSRPWTCGGFREPRAPFGTSRLSGLAADNRTGRPPAGVNGPSGIPATGFLRPRPGRVRVPSRGRSLPRVRPRERKRRRRLRCRSLAGSRRCQESRRFAAASRKLPRVCAPDASFI